VTFTGGDHAANFQKSSGKVRGFVNSVERGGGKNRESHIGLYILKNIEACLPRSRDVREKLNAGPLPVTWGTGRKSGRSC